MHDAATNLSFILYNTIVSFVKAQNKKKYNLGNSVTLVSSKPFLLPNKTPIVLYRDSACKKPLLKLTKEQTTCPTCMGCAEPADYYNGTINPLICTLSLSDEGMIFLARRYDTNKFEVFTDKKVLLLICQQTKILRIIAGRTI